MRGAPHPLAREKVPHQQGDVLDPAAQGRHGDAVGSELGEQVGAEALLLLEAVELVLRFRHALRSADLALGAGDLAGVRVALDVGSASMSTARGTPSVRVRSPARGR